MQAESAGLVHLILRNNLAQRRKDAKEKALARPEGPRAFEVGLS